ncbi:MAG TPA: hypothetical protein VN631_18730 [Negativicutes bacterium]|nr:hypothetical protein [Negativicutes bacterium]
MNCDGSNQKPDSEIYPNIGAPFDSSHVSVILGCQQTYDGRKKKASASRRRTRLLYILFFVVLLLTASGCGSAADIRPAQGHAEETAAPTASEEPSVSIEEQVLLEEQEVKITALSIYDTCESPRLRILIENNGENEITVTLWQAQINGKAIQFNDMNCVVEAGKEETAAIKLFNYFAFTIKDIELGFRIHDNVAMTDTDFNVITIKPIETESAAQTDDADDTVKLGKNGVIYKEGGVTIYVGSYQAPSTYDDSPAFEIGIGNDSDYEVNAYFRNFIINGQAVESAKLNFDHSNAGNGWYEFMSFDLDELTYLGITALETVDFQLRVRTFDGISDKIQIYKVSLSFPKSTGNDLDFIYPEVTAVVEDIEAEAKTFANSIVGPFNTSDKYGIKLTAISFDTTDADLSHWSTTFNFLVENNTDEDLSCRMTYASINGVMVEASIALPSYDPYIHSGEQSSCSISISNDSLIAAGIQTIKDIDLSFELRSSYPAAKVYPVQWRYTAAPESFVQVLDDSGTVILNQDDVKVVVQGFHNDFYLDASYVKLYIENNSDRAIDFSIRDVTINGVEKQPSTIGTVYPGKVAYDKIEFGLLELDYDDLLEFRLEMCDADTDAAMFETDLQSLSFPK